MLSRLANKDKYISIFTDHVKALASAARQLESALKTVGDQMQAAENAKAPVPAEAMAVPHQLLFQLSNAWAASHGYPALPVEPFQMKPIKKP
jgi:hypothetical protein